MDDSNKKTKINGSLTKIEILTANQIDCFILMKTLIPIYTSNVKSMNQSFAESWWNSPHNFGGYQSNFTLRCGSIGRLSEIYFVLDLENFSEVFGKEIIKINTYCNVLSSISFLEGLVVNGFLKMDLILKKTIIRLWL